MELEKYVESPSEDIKVHQQATTSNVNIEKNPIRLDTTNTLIKEGGDHLFFCKRDVEGQFHLFQSRRGG